MSHSFSINRQNPRGAGCMIMARPTGRFLFGRRSSDAPAPNTWSIFGGSSEGMETASETAIREFFEETGRLLRKEDLNHLFHFDLTTFSFDTFISTVEEEFTPYLTVETSDSKWLTLEDIPSNIHEGLRAILEDKITVNRLIRYVENTSGRPCDFEKIYRRA